MNITNIGLTLLLFIAGVGIPIMASMNANISTRIGSPISAIFILSLVTLTSSLIIIVITGLPELKSGTAIPKSYYAAGFFFMLYILATTIAVPKIGVGNAIFLILLGQIFSATTLDHYGLFTEIKIELSPYRILGIAFITTGIFLARR